MRRNGHEMISMATERYQHCYSMPKAARHGMILPGAYAGPWKTVLVKHDVTTASTALFTMGAYIDADISPTYGHFYVSISLFYFAIQQPFVKRKFLRLVSSISTVAYY